MQETLRLTSSRGGGCGRVLGLSNGSRIISIWRQAKLFISGLALSFEN